jgi:tetratricopeptide (TPR) repeat protein
MYDPAEGLKWGEEAGMRGNACSAWRLSIAYKSGDHSFPKDLTKAEYWGKIAIDNKAEDETHRHRYLENYANIECELGVYDDALNYYNQAAKLKDDGYIELMIGFVYEKQGNVQEALIHYEKAVSMGDKYSKDALVSLQLLKTNMQ